MEQKDYFEKFWFNPEDGKSYMVRFDSGTGDVIGKFLLPESKKDISDYFQGGFKTVHDMFWMRFYEEKFHEYNKLELGVIGWLVRNVERDNYIRNFRQTDLAKIFKSDQSNISRALRKIEKDGLVTKDESRKGQYLIAPDYVRYIFGDGGRAHAEEVFKTNKEKEVKKNGEEGSGEPGVHA